MGLVIECDNLMCDTHQNGTAAWIIIEKMLVFLETVTVNRTVNDLNLP